MRCLRSRRRIALGSLALSLGLVLAWTAPADANPLGRLVQRITEPLRYGAERARQRRQIRRNARAGRRREAVVGVSHRLRYFASSVQPQRELLDARGRLAVDPLTGQGRRMDWAVVSPLGYVDTLVEVTSPTASKRAQHAKRRRIMKRYKKLYIRDQRDNRLVPIRKGPIFPTRFKTVRLR